MDNDPPLEGRRSKLIPLPPNFRPLADLPDMRLATTPKREPEVLASCPEFSVIVEFDGWARTTMQPEIERAWCRSITGTNDDINWPRRAALALALSDLQGFASLNREFLTTIGDTLYFRPPKEIEVQKVGVAVQVATALAATLGLALEEVRTSADPEQALKDLCAFVESGLRGCARMNGLSVDRRRKWCPRVCDVIFTGQIFFGLMLRRPAKSEIRVYVEDRMGRCFSGKNVASKWTDLFLAAGLSALPDEPHPSDPVNPIVRQIEACRSTSSE